MMCFLAEAVLFDGDTGLLYEDVYQGGEKDAISLGARQVREHAT